MAKRTVRKRVPRTRNAGTMTEVEYYSRIRSSLRRAFRFWKPMSLALERASRPYKGPNKRQRKEYQCNVCKAWFPRSGVEIDHIVECGSLMSLEDIAGFISRLTVEDVKGYQVLCKKHHKEKTQSYLKAKRKK